VFFCRVRLAKDSLQQRWIDLVAKIFLRTSRAAKHRQHDMIILAAELSLVSFLAANLRQQHWIFLIAQSSTALVSQILAEDKGEIIAFFGIGGRSKSRRTRNSKRVMFPVFTSALDLPLTICTTR